MKWALNKSPQFASARVCGSRAQRILYVTAHWHNNGLAHTHTGTPIYLRGTHTHTLTPAPPEQRLQRKKSEPPKEEKKPTRCLSVGPLGRRPELALASNRTARDGIAAVRQSYPEGSCADHRRYFTKAWRERGRDRWKDSETRDGARALHFAGARRCHGVGGGETATAGLFASPSASIAAPLLNLS